MGIHSLWDLATRDPATSRWPRYLRDMLGGEANVTLLQAPSAKAPGGTNARRAFQRDTLARVKAAVNNARVTLVDAEGALFKPAYNIDSAPLGAAAEAAVKSALDPLAEAVAPGATLVVVFDHGALAPQLKANEQARRDGANRARFAKRDFVRKLSTLDPDRTLADHTNGDFFFFIADRNWRRQYKALFTDATLARAQVHWSGRGVRTHIRTNARGTDGTGVTELAVAAAEGAVPAGADADTACELRAADNDDDAAATAAWPPFADTGEAEADCFQKALALFATVRRGCRVTIVTGDSDAIGYAACLPTLTDVVDASPEAGNALVVCVRAQTRYIEFDVLKMHRRHPRREDRVRFALTLVLLGTDYCQKSDLGPLTRMPVDTLVDARVQSDLRDAIVLARDRQDVRLHTGHFYEALDTAARTSTAKTRNVKRVAEMLAKRRAAAIAPEAVARIAFQLGYWSMADLTAHFGRRALSLTDAGVAVDFVADHVTAAAVARAAYDIAWDPPFSLAVWRALDAARVQCSDGELATFMRTHGAFTPNNPPPPDALEHAAPAAKRSKAQ